MNSNTNDHEVTPVTTVHALAKFRALQDDDFARREAERVANQAEVRRNVDALLGAREAEAKRLAGLEAARAKRKLRSVQTNEETSDTTEA